MKRRSVSISFSVLLTLLCAGGDAAAVPRAAERRCGPNLPDPSECANMRRPPARMHRGRQYFRVRPSNVSNPLYIVPIDNFTSGAIHGNYKPRKIYPGSQQRVRHSYRYGRKGEVK